MSAASDTPRQTTGQKPPASVSQIVPLHLKYWPIPAPRMHGMMPNTATIIFAFCCFDELSILCPILCPSEEMTEIAQLRYSPYAKPSRGRKRSDAEHPALVVAA